uniref:Uncharacterized protein n=1 Tax=Lactuca sativa TaxID=4236 RepID=A0A9R1VZM7_LACSA|nr:hypothetical protein LSAT_V11C400199650 [Lactuca sativa]
MVKKEVPHHLLHLPHMKQAGSGSRIGTNGYHQGVNVSYVKMLSCLNKRLEILVKRMRRTQCDKLKLSVSFVQFYVDGSSIGRSILAYDMLDKPLQNQRKNAISIEDKLDGKIVLYDIVLDNYLNHLKFILAYQICFHVVKGEEEQQEIGRIQDYVELGGMFSPSLGQHMSPVEYRTILRYRLMIPIFPIDEICPVCSKACLDTFGEHAVHCRELHGFKHKHDVVRDVLFDACRRAGIFVKKEAPVNFLTDPQDARSTLRPADILVFGWIGGKHASVDLTGVSPLVGLWSGGFTVGHAALKADACKVVKHENECIANQHAFVPFAFDTFGFLAPEAVELLNRVQRVMHSNVISPRSTNSYRD